MTRVFTVLTLIFLFVTGCSDSVVAPEDSEEIKGYVSPISIDEVKSLVLDSYVENDKAATDLLSKSADAAYVVLNHSITFDKGNNGTVSFYVGQIKLATEILVRELVVRVEAMDGSILSSEIGWSFRYWDNAFSPAFREVQVTTNAVDTRAYFRFGGRDGDIQFDRWIDGPGPSTFHLPNGEGSVYGKSRGNLSDESRLGVGDTTVEILFGSTIKEVTDLVVLDWATIDSVLEGSRFDFDQIVTDVLIRDNTAEAIGLTRDLSIREGDERVVGVYGTPRDVTFSADLYRGGFYQGLEFFVMSLKPGTANDGKPRWVLDEVTASYNTKG